MRRERVEAELSETQFLALVETMDALGRPLEDWPKVAAVRGWVQLAAARRFVSQRERAARKSGERLSRSRALVQASARFGLKTSRLRHALERAATDGR